MRIGDGGVLVLTDMFGGTPSNLGMTFLEGRVEVITGVNLPMLIKLARPPDRDELLARGARPMREHGPQRHLGRVRPAARGETAEPSGLMTCDRDRS